MNYVKILLYLFFPPFHIQFVSGWLDRGLCYQGLITEERENIDPDALPFARKVKEIGRQGLMEGASLEEVVGNISCALSVL